MASHYSYFLGGIGLVVGIFAGAYGLARSRRVRPFDLGIAKAQSKISFRQLAHVPTLRSSDPVVSGWFVITYVTGATQMVQKGFNKVGSPPCFTGDKDVYHYMLNS